MDDVGSDDVAIGVVESGGESGLKGGEAAEGGWSWRIGERVGGGGGVRVEGPDDVVFVEVLVVGIGSGWVVGVGLFEDTEIPESGGGSSVIASHIYLI